MPQTATLLFFLFPLAYSPGPGNLFFAASGARYGFRATLRANAGYHLATWLVTATIGLGLFAIGSQNATLFQALQLTGSAYVLWLAWKLARVGEIGTAEQKPAGFWAGALLLLLNPKAYVIIALMFSQFLDPGAQDALQGTLVITTIFTLNNLLAFCLWTWLGAWLAAQFRSPQRARWLHLGFAVLLATVALWMLLV